MEFEEPNVLEQFITLAAINEKHKVYLVQDRNTNKFYVRKELSTYNKAVYDDLQLLQPLKGIPKIIACVEVENQMTVIEEYISGDTLEQRLEENPNLPEEQMIRYLSEICDILKPLHRMDPPMVHRDIKPANIIITNCDHVYLLDFNAAKFTFLDQEEDTVLIGTKGYAAPEQCGYGISTPVTDIYAIGAVLKEYVKSNIHLKEKYQSVIDKCMENSQAYRYQSVDELQSAFANDTAEDGTSSAVTHKTMDKIPPGFRTKEPWKMVVASLTYLFLGYLSMTLEIEGRSGFALWADRCMLLLMFLSIVLTSFNYCNILSYVPLCRSKNILVKSIGIVLFDAFQLLFYVMLITAVESFFSIT